jgi:uncharacterized membrane protein YdbT with pleckstrin-like domain
VTTPASAALDEPEEVEVWRGGPDSLTSPVAGRTTTYVITTERIKVDSGLVGRRAEQIELFRVKDVVVGKSLVQRSRGRGDVKIISTDPSTRALYFQSIERPEEVAETIRKAAREARRRHGVSMRENM